MATLTVASCKESKQPVQALTDDALTTDAVTNDMVNIDEISECEKIVEDSTLENGKGEKAWKRVGGKIRIKNGDRFYLRRETKDGNVTTVTYRYTDK